MGFDFRLTSQNLGKAVLAYLYRRKWRIVGVAFLLFYLGVFIVLANHTYYGKDKTPVKIRSDEIEPLKVEVKM